MKKKYNYVLLDWDGCLAKTLDLWLNSYKQTFAEFDIFPDDSSITTKVFGDWQGPTKLGISNIDEFHEKLLERVRKEYQTVELYENVIEVIRELKNMGKKVALTTSSNRSMVEMALSNHKLSEYFDLILTQEDVSKHKPDPEVIEKAIKLLEGNKEEIMIVGDSKSDLGAAQNALIDSVLFYPSHNKLFYKLDYLKVYKPTYIIEDFTNLLDIV